MYHTGIVSISFRENTPEKIALAASKCGLKYIEWGSDVHVPCQEHSEIERVIFAQKYYGVSCSSYGTYFRLGQDSLSDLPAYFFAAKRLGTNILRLWAGRKSIDNCTPDERRYLIGQCKEAARLAQQFQMIICLECHRRSYTETKEGALDLMQAVDSPHLRMYWQPNPDISVDENLEYIKLLNPYITHIHVFHWVGKKKLSLKEGIAEWQQYLSALNGDHTLLLEFMPDDSIKTLTQEAEALHNLIQLQKIAAE